MINALASCCIPGIGGGPEGSYLTTINGHTGKVIKAHTFWFVSDNQKNENIGNTIAKVLDVVLGITVLFVGILALTNPLANLGLSSGAQWACIGAGGAYTLAMLGPPVTFMISKQFLKIIPNKSYPKDEVQ